MAAEPDRLRLRAAEPADAATLAGIYAPYVTETVITFEVEPPDSEEMRARIEAAGDLYPWIVAEKAGQICGYAYASAFRARPAYRFVVETTVYTRLGEAGRGTGSALYERLLPILEAQGFTQAIAAVTLPNDPSVRLHERFGFKPAGTYVQVGWKLGGWRDVGLWQRPLAPPQIPPTEPRPWRDVAPTLSAA